MPARQPEPVGPLRRRTLLTATAAATVGAFVGPGRAGAGPLWYQQRFAATVAADPDIRAYLGAGQEFWYRPRQLLVLPADHGKVLTRLGTLGYAVTTGVPFGGLNRIVFVADVDIKLVVDDLRDPANWPASVPPVVQPHHVVFGYPNVMGNPDSAPGVAPAENAPKANAAGTGQLVGICDTGIWAQAAAYHAKWLEGAYTATPAEFDPLYLDDGTLALQAGHGTFIAGILRRTAPAIHFDPTVALSPSGIGDEESVCAAIAALSPAVTYINLSLGCYTQGNAPSMPMAHALATRPSMSVVVAAAGNATSARPTWPAAFPDVIGVAALSRNWRGALIPAPYSNHGGWVDLCAPGTWTSPYVTGSLEPPEEQPLEFAGWATWRGTSFAAPYVVGRIAAMVTADGVSPPAAATALRSGPVPFPGYGAAVT
jgi:hypothetical protein